MAGVACVSSRGGCATPAGIKPTVAACTPDRGPRPNRGRAPGCPSHPRHGVSCTIPHAGPCATPFGPHFVTQQDACTRVDDCEGGFVRPHNVHCPVTPWLKHHHVTLVEAAPSYGLAVLNWRQSLPWYSTRPAEAVLLRQWSSPHFAKQLIRLHGGVAPNPRPSTRVGLRNT
jgi:hypothetical protein